MSDAYSVGATSTIDLVTLSVEVRDCTIVVSEPRLLVPQAVAVPIRWRIDTEGWEFDGPGIGLEGARVEPDGARVAPGTQSIELTVNTLAASVTNYWVKVRRKEVECVEIQTFGFSINTFPITPIGTCDLTIDVSHNNNQILLSKLHADAGTEQPMTIEWILSSDSFKFTANGIEFTGNPPKFKMMSHEDNRICFRNDNDDVDPKEYKYSVKLQKKCDPTFVVFCDPGIKNGSG